MSVVQQPLTLRISDWIAGRRGPEAGAVLLDRKRVYILPTRAGLVFGAAMLVLLVGSINYGLQLGFLLTFLVTSMAIVGMHHTHRNLAQITLRGQRAESSFAGDVVHFELAATNPTAESRHALHFGFVVAARPFAWLRLWRREPLDAGRALPGVTLDLAAGDSRAVSLGLRSTRRGRLACPRICVDTRFPFGLWRAWAYLTPALTAIIYPTPEAQAPPLPLTGAGTLEGTTSAVSGDDFAGVRPYQEGDPHKTIAWRLAARSDTLAVKLFDATGGGEVALDFAALPPGMPLEAKLSRLTRWVLDADAAQLRYVLRLPGREVPLGSGTEHRERCLTELALVAA
jgi:uncharacterized protein (DUF58 family)